MKRRYYPPAHPLAPLASNAEVELIYRSPCGDVQRKFQAWKRPTTEEALSEYVEDYLEFAAEGYIPAGFDYTPMPHAARVRQNGKVVAEWKSGPSLG